MTKEENPFSKARKTSKEKPIFPPPATEPTPFSDLDKDKGTDIPFPPKEETKPNPFSDLPKK